MAATEADSRRLRFMQAAALLPGVVAALPAQAAVLEEDHADAMMHYYRGGGVSAWGPAFDVSKQVGSSFALTGYYYVDTLTSASIDVVTTASEYHERRNEGGLGLGYVYGDALINLKASRSSEPDYKASRTSVDLSQEVFGASSLAST